MNKDAGQWVNAAERQPELVMSVNLKIDGRPGYGKFYKDQYGLHLGFEATNGWGTLDEDQFNTVFWLDESSTGTKISDEDLRQLKLSLDAFQWTWDNMHEEHTPDHFNVPANGIFFLQTLLDYHSKK